jgi:hypothetical protein
LQMDKIVIKYNEHNQKIGPLVPKILSIFEI